MRGYIEVVPNMGSFQPLDDRARMRLHEPFAGSHVEEEP